MGHGTSFLVLVLCFLLIILVGDWSLNLRRRILCEKMIEWEMERGRVPKDHRGVVGVPKDRSPIVDERSVRNFSLFWTILFILLTDL